MENIKNNTSTLNNQPAPYKKKKHTFLKGLGVVLGIGAVIAADVGIALMVKQAAQPGTGGEETKEHTITLTQPKSGWTLACDKTQAKKGDKVTFSVSRSTNAEELPYVIQLNEAYYPLTLNESTGVYTAEVTIVYTTAMNASVVFGQEPGPTPTTTFTVTFDANYEGGTTITQKVIEGEKATPAHMERDGYSLEGWYTEKECQNKFDFSTTITANKQLFANWKAVEAGQVKFTINFITTSDKGQGEITKGDSTYKCYEDSIAWNKIASPTVKYKPKASEEMIFDAWYTEKECINKVKADAVFTKNTDLYAGYVESSIGEFKDYLYTYTDNNNDIWMYDYQTIEANEGKIVRYNVSQNWEVESIDRDKFDEPIAIGKKVTALGDSFLNNCIKFNQELIIPDSVKTIGEDFMWNCTSFAQKITIPATVDAINKGFMNDCQSFTELEINCPETSIIAPNDEETCSTTKKIDGHSITVSGSLADTFKSKFPDLSGPYNWRTLKVQK